MTAATVDVVVVGGGPAGATAAFQLASAGIGVTLIDRAHFPRDKVCGESLSPGAISRLQAIGMWPSGHVTASTAPIESMQVRGMRLRSPRGRTFSGHYKGGGGGVGLVARRTLLDHELLSMARGRGARVIEGLEATSADATQGGGAVISVREAGRSCATRIEARRVIVADGRRSFIARQIGFIEAEPPSRGRSRFAVRAHCDGVSDLTDLAEMQVGRGGYCGIAPLSRTSANICYVLFATRLDMRPETIEADFQRDLERFPEVARRLENARVTGAIRVAGPLRLESRRHAKGPFIACGDTTGFLDPFTGEGIAHAIATGALAADAVRTSLSGDARAFPGYERDVRSLRRVKSAAALLLYSLVSRPALADSTAALFSRMPRLADSIVRLFGDQI